MIDTTFGPHNLFENSRQHIPLGINISLNLPKLTKINKENLFEKN
jgi:hypothetical protein